MEKNQNNQLTMHLSAQVVLDENKIKFDFLTAYAAIKEKLDKSISDEQSIASNQESYKRISTAARNKAKRKAADFALDLSNKLSALAIVTDNLTLLDQVRLIPSKVYRYSDNRLVIIFENLLQNANENKLKVLEYGITDIILAEGANILESLKIEMQNLLLINAEQKQLTSQLKKQFTFTRTVFKAIDAMVEAIRFSEPVLYRLYRNARKIINVAGTKLSVVGKVFDADTNLPLPKAKISIISCDNSQTLTLGPVLKKHIKITGTLGGFREKLRTTGAYLIKVIYAGYASKEVIVYFNEGILTRVEIPMTKLDRVSGN